MQSDMMICLNDGSSKIDSFTLDFFKLCEGLRSDVGCCFSRCVQDDLEMFLIVGVTDESLGSDVFLPACRS